MIEIDNFIKEELNDYSRDLILSTINSGKRNNKTKEILIFNRYSLEFLFKEKTVFIYDDIYPDYGHKKLNFDEFIGIIW
ncbi:MAG: hypothetical protein KTR22_06625 [Flavobacteriaceae bacterium]|nr:hypothetical protein [Flavobacteriaceae bacterium]